MRYLTFALGKGRLAKQTLELFEKIGITCEEMKDKKTRKLIFVNENLKLKFFLSKEIQGIGGVGHHQVKIGQIPVQA